MFYSLLILLSLFLFPSSLFLSSFVGRTPERPDRSSSAFQSALSCRGEQVRQAEWRHVPLLVTNGPEESTSAQLPSHASFSSSHLRDFWTLSEHTGSISWCAEPNVSTAGPEQCLELRTKVHLLMPTPLHDLPLPLVWYQVYIFVLSVCVTMCEKSGFKAGCQ